ncbi:LppX_LprAFG lipoprotein [Gordonia sp. VNK21]|uniref:LppX_LprAFG lipoprotein n=1 Tax=Gordonia sp. VNK21 TaxID=3382483 RepID=UPI0038D4D8B3
MHRPNRLVAAVVALGAAAALSLTACSSDDSGEKAPASSDPAASELLTKAADSTEALKGAHITVTVNGDLPGMNATSVVADVNTDPVSGSGEATLNMGGTESKAPFVYLDDRLYANVQDKGWIDYGDGRSIYDASKVLDPEAGVPAILRSLEGAQEAGKEDVDGVSATKVTGTVPASKVAGLTGATGKSATEATEALDTTVWVTDDNQVAKVEVAPAAETTVTVTLSDWNKTVEVSKPDDVETPKATPTTSAPADQPTREKAPN